MLLLDLSLPSIVENLALDEALLVQAEVSSAGEVLRFWEQPTWAVVLGVSGIIGDDVRQEACAAAQVPLARRASGGGTVLLGPGCLCYSLVLDMEQRPCLRAVTSSYHFILSKLGAALDTIMAETSGRVGGFLATGQSDLAWVDPTLPDNLTKVSGNSQKRGRRFLLHHGTLLLNFDLQQVSHFLKEPPRQPSYRNNRPHSQFIANLQFGMSSVKTQIANAFGAKLGSFNAPNDHCEQLIREKYARPEWTRRR